MNKVRKVPLRKCVGCQEMRPKRELIRVVHTPEGEVLIDSTGKRNGRGAYLCPDENCLHMAMKRKSLERALKMSIPEAVYHALEQQLNEAVRPS
ncbi:RNase P modulator RnpM [Alicyclobacillus dauci]|uniref:YlxR family protein n=1 Tax=Alicyclobacillus dauci TaxID=1475485 RepID=A0ABY6YYJ5_9BACL|nr:YlxR family protein [Alicyclobacillus dauci]WAH35368.1 YlxR family protein [Alicyclobacillus dauci]